MDYAEIKAILYINDEMDKYNIVLRSNNKPCSCSETSYA